VAAITLVAGLLVAAPAARGERTARADPAPVTFADLTVHAASDATGPIDKGDAVRYSFTVENLAGATAHLVTVTVSLPHRVTPIHLLPTMEGGSCSVVGSTDAGSVFTVFCSRRLLEAATAATVTVDVRIDRDRPCGPIRTTAVVAASDEPAAARGDDEASRTDAVACEASMRIQHPAPAFARVGEVTTIRFDLVNDGEVVLHDLSVAGPGCEVVASGPILRPGHGVALRCIRRITGRRAVIRVGLTASSPEGRSLHATAAARVSVIHPEVAVSLPERVSGRVGSTVSYRIVVTNSGDSPLVDLVVRRNDAGVIGRLGALSVGEAASLRTVEALGAAGTHSDLITVTGTDRSGAHVTVTASATVLAAPSPGGRPDTAFTGDPASADGVASAILALLGVGALAFARRRRVPALPR
jgi:MYXO-CTERM domain-containing protein